MSGVRDRDPVLLAYGPHPVHRRMAGRIGAEVVDCEEGGPLARIRSGASRDFGNRPVVVEGGVPLLEVAALSLLGSCGPVVELAADATHLDLHRPLPFRGRAGRLAHRVGERAVDATIAVSDVLATLAGADGRPVRVAHPFVLSNRYETLTDLDVDVGGSDVVCVGANRPKNGQSVLLEAIDHVDADVTVHFVGPETEAVEEAAGIERHGFVPEVELVELLDDAALAVFPALVGAFPVVNLEAFCAGLPVVTTPGVGNAGLVRTVDDRFVVEPEPEQVAEAIDWYLSLPTGRREAYAEVARAVGRRFDEDAGLRAFERQFDKVLESLGGRGNR